MMQSQQLKLQGKMIKDYVLQHTISSYGTDSQVVHALKNDKLHVTIYAIRQQIINPDFFVPYNNEIAENGQGIYPTYYEIVKSQNYFYMVFEDLEPLSRKLKQPTQIQKVLKSMQMVLMIVRNKINKHELFLKKDGSFSICYLPSFNSFPNKTSNLYSKFHNKSILAQLFCQIVPVNKKNQCLNKMIEVFENADLVAQIKPYVRLSGMGNLTHLQTKGVSIIQQANNQYPDIDDEEFEELVKEIHVNSQMKKQANQAFMRQSLKARHDDQAEKSNKQFTSIVENIKNSMFDFKHVKSKAGKSKYEIKLNQKKMEENQFELYYNAYTEVFKLFKNTIRSYLSIYKHGFSGILAAYLLTLIGAMRKIRLICDLDEKNDIFNVGEYVEKMDYRKHITSLKKDLVKDARNIANLKNMIERSTMPMKTYEALTPFLEEDISLIDEEEVAKFCFFYMTALLKTRNIKDYHDILALETMYVVINHDGYEIVYSEEDQPKKWDEDYYQLKKALIYGVIPSWSL